MKIRISTSSIKRDAEKIDQYSESIPTLIKELEASMGRLSTCWEGPAWGAYQQTVAEYMDILTEIYQGMKKYTSSMQMAGQDYHRAEQDVCSSIDKIIVL